MTVLLLTSSRRGHLGLEEQCLIWAICPSCYPSTSVKAQSTEETKARPHPVLSTCGQRGTVPFMLTLGRQYKAKPAKKFLIFNNIIFTENMTGLTPWTVFWNMWNYHCKNTNPILHKSYSAATVLNDQSIIIILTNRQTMHMVQCPQCCVYCCWLSP